MACCWASPTGCSRTSCAATTLINLVAYVIGTAVLVGIAFVAYRATQAHKMVTQYPWLYERAGPFSWRKI